MPFPWLEAWRSNETGPGGLFSFGSELTVRTRRVFWMRQFAPSGFYTVRLWKRREPTRNVVRSRRGYRQGCKIRGIWFLPGVLQNLS